MIELGAEAAVDLLATTVRALPTPAGARRLIAIAGAPASGKSTIAKALVNRLNELTRSAILVPMDGFHLDNRVLDDRGQRNIKGSPETFDATGFLYAMQRLRDEPDLYLPTFDRDRDISVAGAIFVDTRHSIAVIEGNYLCFDEAPWNKLLTLWDLTVYIDVAQETIEARLKKRWLDQGLSTAAAMRKVNENDLPNATRVAKQRTECDLFLRIFDAT